MNVIEVIKAGVKVEEVEEAKTRGAQARAS